MSSAMRSARAAGFSASTIWGILSTAAWSGPDVWPGSIRRLVATSRSSNATPVSPVGRVAKLWRTCLVHAQVAPATQYVLWRSETTNAFFETFWRRIAIAKLVPARLQREPERSKNKRVANENTP